MWPLDSSILMKVEDFVEVSVEIASSLRTKRGDVDVDVDDFCCCDWMPKAAFGREGAKAAALLAATAQSIAVAAKENFIVLLWS